MQLTAIEPEDLEVLYQIENDPGQWNVGGYHVPFSRYDLREYILSQQHDIYLDRQLRLVIREEGRAVGLIDLFNFSPENMRAELGLAILPQERGKGYSTEALRLMLDYCRKHLMLHQVYCIVPDDNLPSLSMLRSVGFSHEVTLPQWLQTYDKWQDCKQMFFFL